MISSCSVSSRQNVNDIRAALHNTQNAKEVTRRRRRVTTTVSSNDGVAAAVSLPRQRCSDRQLAKAVASTRAAAQADPAGRDLTLDFLAGSETETRPSRLSRRAPNPADSSAPAFKCWWLDSKSDVEATPTRAVRVSREVTCPSICSQHRSFRGPTTTWTRPVAHTGRELSHSRQIRSLLA
jgi:hypothetical protein